MSAVFDIELQDEGIVNNTESDDDDIEFGEVSNYRNGMPEISDTSVYFVYC